MSRKRYQGFSLIDVLVALLMFSLAGVAITLQFRAQAETAESLMLRTMGTWVAENEIVTERLRAKSPGYRAQSRTSSSRMGGRSWTTTIEPTRTANSKILQIDVVVTAADRDVRIHLSGFVNAEEDI